MRRRTSEDGYALVAAVASIAVFAAMALMVMAATRTALADAAADQGQLQAAAAADAGTALALSGLLATDPADRWLIDGRIRALRYGVARLRIRIEDERGKVPLSRLDEKQATRLLEQAGLSGDRLSIARDSLLDWIDSDDLPRPFGAEAAYYRSAGLRPPNGFLASVDELGSVRGFDAATIARIRPLVTSSVGFSTPFDARFADPRALAVMSDAGENGVAALERARTLAGERTAIDLSTDSADLTGRPLTIAVDASLPEGGHAQRRTTVELTGATARRYVVRAYE